MEDKENKEEAKVYEHKNDERGKGTGRRQVGKVGKGRVRGGGKQGRLVKRDEGGTGEAEGGGKKGGERKEQKK